MEQTSKNEPYNLVMTGMDGLQESHAYYASEEKIPALMKTKSTYKGKVYESYSTSRVHLPASWAGKKVLCVLLQEPGTVPSIEPKPEPKPQESE